MVGVDIGTFVSVSDIGLRFVHALVNADAFAGDLENLTYMLDKRSRWQPEFAVWCENGEPTGPDDAGWAVFAKAVESK